MGSTASGILVYGQPLDSPWDRDFLYPWEEQDEDGEIEEDIDIEEWVVQRSQIGPSPWSVYYEANRSNYDHDNWRKYLEENPEVDEAQVSWEKSKSAALLEGGITFVYHGYEWGERILAVRDTAVDEIGRAHV